MLPGVGAFADCKAGLDAVAGMRDALETSVRAKGRPFLGICVGAQLMAERGLEFRTTPGFGWIKGDVKAIEPRDPTLKIPHMGWNTLTVINDHPLLDGHRHGSAGPARILRALLPPRSRRIAQRWWRKPTMGDR